MHTCARSGASVLRSETGVDAVELFDRASLRECEADEVGAPRWQWSEERDVRAEMWMRAGVWTQ
eukprot:358516-Chlamydomonas_euryale.AAC.3